MVRNHLGGYNVLRNYAESNGMVGTPKILKTKNGNVKEHDIYGIN